MRIGFPEELKEKDDKPHGQYKEELGQQIIHRPDIFEHEVQRAEYEQKDHQGFTPSLWIRITERIDRDTAR